MGGPIDWALSFANGEGKSVVSDPLRWDEECARLFAVVDALTHTGRLTVLRRLHGAPMKGESYYRADVVIGRTGAGQTPADPGIEFDLGRPPRRRV